MIDRTHQLSVAHQAKALGVSRSTVYYRPKAPSDETLALMHRIDRLHLEHPFAGSRMLRDLLRLEGFQVGRDRVRNLMRKMGVQPLYRRPRTTQRHPEHKVYPYLLRDLPITQPNHVWALDITYIPMARGFVYLVAVLDWYSRRVLAWRLSVTMHRSFCIDALQDAIDRYGAPGIVNTDQGSQFTSTDFTDVLKANNIRISMDGKGSWRDNVFIERLWRTVKYEEVYLHAYQDPFQARSALNKYFQFYNSRRPHSVHNGQTPDRAYFPLAMPEAA